MQRLLNNGWSFSLGDPAGFRPVRLPHDWLIHDPEHWYQSGTGWYRRMLHADFLKEGRRAWLHFNGVCMDSTLYVNGQNAGEWKYGFTAFEHEITGFLKPDADNELLLKVDCRYPSSRWYTGAGIYRDVSLVIKDSCHFTCGGIYVSTSLKDNEWMYDVSAEAETGGQPYEVRHRLLEAGEIISWSPECPNLYTLRCELVVAGRVRDTMDTRIGFRQLRFHPDKGFSINGRNMKLNGACLHQEFSMLGAAVHPDIIRRQFLKLKEMGVNAVRTAHNPPSSAFMDLADEMGMLVVSEFTDVWEISKTAYDYARFFREWHERDAASWVRRDRNRPSVIMWSLGNEIPDTHADYENGSRILENLSRLVRLHDPRSQAPVTMGSNYMPWENTQHCAELLGAAGYNYAEYLYAGHYRAHPGWIIYGSETCSTVQSRGVYHFPLRQPMLSDDDLQCSSLGNSTTSWGARSIEACVRDDRDAHFSLGQFVWAGQDYLGEPTPYHTKNSYFGMLDTAGFEKDAYYMFQAAWSDPDACPMVHLFPYWDFSPGQPVDVRVCSNQAEVALYLDGECLGRRMMEGGFVQDWVIPFRPGVLHAEAMDKNGRLAASTTRCSFGEAESLSMSFQLFDALGFADITALDGEGRLVENANRLVRVRVAGCELLGLDNGDAADATPYQNDTRRMFSGKLLALVRRTPGQEPHVTAEFVQDDIRVRKIELTREGYEISARVLPENAAASLQWRLTNAAGVDSNLGGLRVDGGGRKAVVIPKGDGEACVRCGVKDSHGQITLYSQIPIQLNGFGKPALDPFSFISAGLFAYSSGGLTNGNERGVATPRDKRVFILYDGLDFTDKPSDELSVWLFPLTHEPFSFEIWEGRPDTGGSLLCQPLYDLGMIWNVYQEMRIRLPRRLNGNVTISFAFSLKTHFKGFVFHRDARAYRQLRASEHDAIYGDNFRQSEGAVLDIGNNTTLVFAGLDFTGAGADRVEIVWQSDKPGNAVQLQFHSRERDIRMMIGLSRSVGYRKAVFPLERPLMGSGSISLVFLPGCAVDLASLRFISAGEGA